MSAGICFPLAGLSLLLCPSVCLSACLPVAFTPQLTRTYPLLRALVIKHMTFDNQSLAIQPMLVLLDVLAVNSLLHQTYSLPKYWPTVTVYLHISRLFHFRQFIKLYYTVSQKTSHQTLANNFTKY